MGIPNTETYHAQQECEFLEMFFRNRPGNVSRESTLDSLGSFLSEQIESYAPNLSEERREKILSTLVNLMGSELSTIPDKER